jgi:hypothetical protein
MWEVSSRSVAFARKKTGLNARFEMENYHESALQRSQRAIKV